MTTRQAIAITAVILVAAGCRPASVSPILQPSAPGASSSPTPAASSVVTQLGSPSLAVDPATGDAAVVWTETTGDHSSLMFQRLPAGNDVPSSPRQLATGTNRLHRAAISATGGVHSYLVAWPDAGLIGSAIRVQWFDSTGMPSSPVVQVSPRETIADEPFVGCTPEGCLTAWWDGRYDAADTFGAWITPKPAPSTAQIQIAAEPMFQRITDLVVDADRSTAWAVWPDSHAGRIGIASLALPGTQPARLTALAVASPDTPIGYPRLAVDQPSGRVCVAWTQAERDIPAIKVGLIDPAGNQVGNPKILVKTVKADRVLAVVPLPSRQGFAATWVSFRYEQVETGYADIPDKLWMQGLNQDGDAIGQPKVLLDRCKETAIAFDSENQGWVVVSRQEDKTWRWLRVTHSAIEAALGSDHPLVDLAPGT